MKKMICLLLMAIMLTSASLLFAQVPPAEADSEAFLSANFNLQDTYNRVLCVSNSDSCPTEITTSVPCLIIDCNKSEQTYSINQIFNTIQSASDATQSGDLVIIMPGQYAGVQVESTGGEDGAYIHFSWLG